MSSIKIFQKDFIRNMKHANKRKTKDYFTENAKINHRFSFFKSKI